MSGEKRPRSRNQGICAVPSCDKDIDTLQWCATHYSRWRKHGAADRGLRSCEECGTDITDGHWRAVSRCNLGLGWFKDSVAALGAAIDYLNDPRPNAPRALIRDQTPATRSVCTTDGCQARPAARGLCSRHYMTAKRAGELPPLTVRALTA